jgi:UDP-glucose 4-epimerase
MNYLNHYGLKVLHGQCRVNLRILITGGFGFIGGRFALQLAQAGHQIVLGSRNASTPPVWLPKAEVVQIEWDDDASLEHCCSDIDVVIHAAGMNAQECAADPVAALAFNGLATARLVAAANRARVPRFIYLSTAHVYASPLAGTFTEKTCPSNLHPYATSHLAGEQAVLSASQRGQMQGIVLRLSNAFGAPMHSAVNCWMLLVNDLCKQAVQTRKLVLHTNGLQQRDFIALSDVCRFIEYLIMGHGELAQPAIFNVGSGESQSVFAMAQIIQQRCREVLSFEPFLQRVECELNEIHPMLHFGSTNLPLLGIRLKNTDHNAEIDKLLRFCQAAFTPPLSSNA